MSAEDGSAQAHVHNSDKATAPKATATFSSFINKNATGKKFAPKAARRRVPTASTTPATQSAATEPAAPAVESRTSIAVQLPTPAPTQETAASNATNVPNTVEERPSEQSVATPSIGRPRTAEIDQDATHTQVDTLPSQDEADSGTVQGAQGDTGISRNTEPESERVVASQSNLDGRQPSITEVPEAAPQDQITAPALGTSETTVEVPENEVVESGLARQAEGSAWTAVNQAQNEEDASTETSRRTNKVQGRRNNTGEDQADDETTQSASAENVQPSKKARGKRKAAAAPVEEEGEATAPPKRTRRPRRSKVSDRLTTDGTEPGGEAQDEPAELAPAQRKPRQPRKKRQTATGEADGALSTQAKRKGRPPREPTPEEAEDHVIDPEMTFMDGLASRNIRVGKLSNREKQMREINWDAVRQRRKEEDARPIKSKEEQEAADKALADAAANSQQESGPRYRLVNGNIELVPESGTLNREADADREIADYEVIEDRDITSHITMRSFMKNNKRFPNEFVLPGQGVRWTAEGTERFYQGLQSFGTDFQMIAHMFPGVTRRSIKTKFTREEREHPERVREILQGRSNLGSHWDDFLEASQMKEEQFADADEIKRQMAEEEERMRAQIEAAKLETEERNRQKIAAGVFNDEDDTPGAGDKENDKGKRKRNGKDKHVTFQQDDGVEILGNIDDDDTWGQE